MAFGDFAVVRSTIKQVANSAGDLAEVAVNTPAFEFNTDLTYRGLYAESASTNFIRNNTMVGAVAGTPGTAPTNWGQNLGGLSRQIVGTGTLKGVNYIDVRFFGTASATSCEFYFEAGSSIVASSGQTWTSSFYLGIVAQPTPPVAYRSWIIENTSGGSFVTGGSLILSATSTLTRFQHTRTLSGGGTVARVLPGFLATIVSGQSYDFTIRIGLPQMEQSAVMSSEMKTSGSTFNRTADAITLTLASSLIGQQEGTVYAEVFITNFAGATDSIFTISDGTVNNRVEVNKRSPNTIALERVSAIQSGATTISSGALSTGRHKVAIAYKTGDTVMYIDGVQAGSTATATFTMPTLGNLVLGANATAGTRFFNSNISAFAVFPTRLTNAQLATLTTL